MFEKCQCVVILYYYVRRDEDLIFEHVNEPVHAPAMFNLEHSFYNTILPFEDLFFFLHRERIYRVRFSARVRCSHFIIRNELDRVSSDGCNGSMLNEERSKRRISDLETKWRWNLMKCERARLTSSTGWKGCKWKWFQRFSCGCPRKDKKIYGSHPHIWCVARTGVWNVFILCW